MKYTFTVKGKTDEVVTVRAVLNGVGFSQVPIASDGCTDAKAPVLQGGALEWTCRLTAESAQLSITVAADPASSRYGSGTALRFKVGESETWSTFDADSLDGLVPGFDDRFFKPVFGAGFTMLDNDAVDFTDTDNVLLVLNDSRLRVSGLVGGLFRVGSVKRRQVSAMVSLQFTQGTTETLDGFQFGGALELSPYLHLVLGVSRHKGKELSPGFRLAAKDFIAARIAAEDSAFARFAAFDPAVANRENLLDGLPLQFDGQAIFPGPAIIDSYNTAFFLGIVLPVQLKALFAGG